MQSSTAWLAREQSSVTVTYFGVLLCCCVVLLCVVCCGLWVVGCGLLCAVCCVLCAVCCVLCAVCCLLVCCCFFFLLFLTQLDEDAMCLSTRRYGLIGMRPRRRRTLRRRGLRKLALNSGTTRRSAKTAEKNDRIPISTRPQPPHGEVVDELRQQDLHNRDIDHPVQMHCKLLDLHSFLDV